MVGLLACDPTRVPPSTGTPEPESGFADRADELVASRADDDPAAALLAAETSADFLAAVLDYPAGAASD